MKEISGGTGKKEHSPLRKAVDIALENNFLYAPDGQRTSLHESPLTKTVSLRRGDLYLNFHPDPNSGPSEFVVWMLKPGLPIEYRSSTSGAEQLRKINDVLGFDLIGKPAGQETGAGTVIATRKNWRQRVSSGIRGALRI